MIRLTKLSLVLLGVCFVANAGAIDVTYTVSGSAGAWDLNFKVANNMTAWPTQDIYQFGVQVSVPNVIGSPTGYDPTAIPVPWTNFFRGGSPLQYNNVWTDFADFNHLLPGTNLSGFTVEVTDDVAPAIVPWFAYSYASTLDPTDFYTGSEAFIVDSSVGAGFEGSATLQPSTGDGINSSASPEPSTWGLLVIGLGIGVFRRRNVLRT